MRPNFKARDYVTLKEWLMLPSASIASGGHTCQLCAHCYSAFSVAVLYRHYRLVRSACAPSKRRFNLVISELLAGFLTKESNTFIKAHVLTDPDGQLIIRAPARPGLL
jgi:hypothetical protein